MGWDFGTDGGVGAGVSEGVSVLIGGRPSLVGVMVGEGIRVGIFVTCGTNVAVTVGASGVFRAIAGVAVWLGPAHAANRRQPVAAKNRPGKRDFKPRIN